MADLRDDVMRAAYYNAHMSHPETPEWSTLSAEERAFYWRIADTVWLHYDKELDILRRRLLQHDLCGKDDNR